MKKNVKQKTRMGPKISAATPPVHVYTLYGMFSSHDSPVKLQVQFLDGSFSPSLLSFMNDILVLFCTCNVLFCFPCLSFLNFPVLYCSGKTDPYVNLRLGDQVIRSKRNSQTTVIGPPGEPIWNQVI